jgi:hypothetical protein
MLIFDISIPGSAVHQVCAEAVLRKLVHASIRRHERSLPANERTRGARIHPWRGAAVPRDILKG